MSEKKENSMGAEKNEYVRKKNSMFQFDPTIHAGHILTVLTIIFCSIGAWYDVKSSVAMLKEENIRQDQKISEIYSNQKEQIAKISDEVSALAAMNRQDSSKIRDDMNAWFIRLNDKLDTKEDKK